MLIVCVQYVHQGLPSLIRRGSSLSEVRDIKVDPPMAAPKVNRTQVSPLSQSPPVKIYLMILRYAFKDKELFKAVKCEL